MKRLYVSLFALTTLAATLSCRAATVQSRTAAPLTSDEERVALHHSAEWLELAAHLPSPDTASAAELETAADVLRARRFPEDALDYYGYALARGGNISRLMNKMGVVRLELQQYDVAAAMFQRVVRSDKHNAEGWNNLGAAEFMNKHYLQAIGDYRKAASLDRRSAIYHSNLGLVYFEEGSMEDARDEFGRAVSLNPAVMQMHDDGGTAAHIVASGDHARLCYEMAKLFATHGDLITARMWLGKAVDEGFPVGEALAKDPGMARFLKDPAVQTMLNNEQKMRARASASGRGAVPLGASAN